MATSAGHREAIMWAREQFGVELMWGDRGLPATVGAAGA